MNYDRQKMNRMTHVKHALIEFRGKAFAGLGMPLLRDLKLIPGTCSGPVDLQSNLDEIEFDLEG